MKKLLITTIILAFAITTFAQHNRAEAKEKIKELKIAFISSKLDLTEKEAVKFWPIYNDREKEHHAIRKQMKAQGKMRSEEITEADAEVMLDTRLQLLREQLAMEERYIKRFKTVIPAKKIVLLTQVEREFKRMLVEKMRGERRER